jgi:hypothetical protein
VEICGEPIPVESGKSVQGSQQVDLCPKGETQLTESHVH